MDDACTITIEDGQYAGTYVTSCQTVEYITEDLCNAGSSTIYLYPAMRTGDSTSYISIASLSHAVYRSSSSYSGTYITDVSSVSFNDRSNYYREVESTSFSFQIVIVAVVVLLLLLRRGK